MKTPQVEVAGTLLLVAACLAGAALAAEPAAAGAAGCPASANATNAHDQIIKLSQLLDPSGRLSKMIADFHPHPAHGHSAAHSLPSASVDPMQVAASEPEPVKRETDVTGATEATTTAASSLPSSSTGAPALAGSSSPADATQAPASTATPPIEGANVTKTPQVATTTAESKNVTVNVFLQLVPDAKTEELINNPNKIASTAAPPSTTSAGQPEVSSSVASSTTAPLAGVASANASTEAPTSAPPAVPMASQAAAKAASRRRRRWAETPSAAAPAPSAPATPAAPAQRAAPLAASSTAAPSTAPPSTSAPSAAPKVPAPSSTALAATTTSTRAPTTTSTTTTTTTTTTAAPAPTSTTTQATVELSARDLAQAASNQGAHKQMSAPSVEILVSAVPVAANTPMAPVPQTASPTAASTAASPATPALATEAPRAASSGAPSTSVPAASAATGAPPASSTTSTTTPTPTTSTTTSKPAVSATQAPASTQPPAAAAPAAALKGGMQSSETATEVALERGRAPNKLTAGGASDAASATHPGTNEVKREATSAQQQRDMNLIDRANELSLDNLNVIYDNDTDQIGPSLSSPPSSNNQQQQQQQASVGASEAKTGTPKSSFVHGEHGDEVQEPQDNFATCALHFDHSLSNSTGRLDFWQPIWNRGALHMLARFRYDASQSPNNSGAPARPKRESFQTLVERAAPTSAGGHRDQPGRCQVDQVYLLDDCRQPAGSRTLLTELKAGAALEERALVDVDAELVLAARFNLAEPNSIVGKCLQLESSQGRRLASCTVAKSDTLPTTSELDHVASVGAVQAVREELVYGVSSTGASSPPPALEGARSPAAPADSIA